MIPSSFQQHAGWGSAVPIALQFLQSGWKVLVQCPVISRFVSTEQRGSWQFMRVCCFLSNLTWFVAAKIKFWFCRRFLAAVVMQILIWKHTDCIQNHISSRSPASDQMTKSILAGIGKLWQYYPLFSPHHPRRSILKLTTFTPGFLQRASVKQSSIFQPKNSWGCYIKMEIRKPQQHFRCFVLCLAGISPSTHWCH